MNAEVNGKKELQNLFDRVHARIFGSGPRSRSNINVTFSVLADFSFQKNKQFQSHSNQIDHLTKDDLSEISAWVTEWTNEFGNNIPYFLGSVIEASLASSNERKSTGSYYTPPVAVRKIVRETLEPLVKNLDAREILKLKVVDPAVGSGNFLIGALEYLESAITKKSPSIKNVRALIAKNCLFGVDINQSALNAATTILATLAGIEGSDLKDNFACANGLDCKRILKRFEKKVGVKGFSAVIGNPPYVDYRSIDSTTLRLAKDFESCKSGDKFSLYIPFLEAAMLLLKPGGYLGFIVPNQWLSAGYGKLLRRYFVQEKTICKIIDVSNLPIFEDAATYPIIVIAQNEQRTKYSFSVQTPISLKEMNNKDSGKKVTTSGLSEENDFRIRTSVSDLDKLWDKVKTLPTLESLCREFRWGTSQAGYGKKKKTVSEINSSDGRIGKTSYKKMIQTSDIKFARIEWGKEFLPAEIYTASQLERFKDPKIVIARVTRRIQCAVDETGFALGKASFILPKDSRTLKSISIILLSSFASVWFRDNFDTVHMNGGYLRFDIPYLKQIPIPKMTDADLRKLDRVYDQMNKSYDQAAIDQAVNALYGFSKKEAMELSSTLSAMDQSKTSRAKSAA